MTQRQRTAEQKAATATDTPKGNKQAQAELDRIKNLLAGPLENKKLSELATTKERLLLLADIIEAQALVAKGIGFNMGDWCDDADHEEVQDRGGHFCDTVACIAGSAVMWEDGHSPSGLNWSIRAQTILGIDSDDAERLFTPSDEHAVGYDATPAQAAEVIRNFAHTGTVNWVSVMKSGDSE